MLVILSDETLEFQAVSISRVQGAQVQNIGANFKPYKCKHPGYCRILGRILWVCTNGVCSMVDHRPREAINIWPSIAQAPGRAHYLWYSYLITCIKSCLAFWQSNWSIVQLFHATGAGNRVLVWSAQTYNVMVSVHLAYNGTICEGNLAIFWHDVTAHCRQRYCMTWMDLYMIRISVITSDCALDASAGTRPDSTTGACCWSCGVGQSSTSFSSVMLRILDANTLLVWGPYHMSDQNSS